MSEQIYTALFVCTHNSARPDAPKLDFVFMVCDKAAG
jgi:hypothetical protein